MKLIIKKNICLSGSCELQYATRSGVGVVLSSNPQLC